MGKGEEDNVEVRRWGTPRNFDFEPKDHVDLLQSLGMVAWDGPRRFAGARSYALMGAGAMLELAITRFTMDLLQNRGLNPVVVPVIVKERALVGTGFFPLGREEAYSIPADDLFLVGTSEVALVSMHTERDPRGVTAPHSLRRHQPVFPSRGRRPRQGHAGPLPGPPVHQGRAGGLLRPR